MAGAEPSPPWGSLTATDDRRRRRPISATGKLRGISNGEAPGPAPPRQNCERLVDYGAGAGAGVDGSGSFRAATPTTGWLGTEGSVPRLGTLP